MDFNENEGLGGEERQPEMPIVRPEAFSQTVPAHQEPAPESETEPAMEASAFTSSTACDPQQHHAAPQPPAPRKKKSMVGLAIASTALIMAGVTVLSCVFTAKALDRRWEEQNRLLAMSYNEKLNVLRKEMEANSNNSTGESVSGTPNTGIEGGMTPAQVYAQNVSSVVAINCTVTGTQFGQVTQGASSGSGFIVTDDGYIATNYHVVENATKLTVTTSDGTQYPAKYIGGDESNDIALIKIEGKGLRAAAIGSSGALVVGDQVAAIGNPLGELASTLTVGYVSAKDRVITTDGSQISMMQTDAAINPGNSGGPLFNMKGQVVGITTAKYSGTTSSGASIEGIGFAIPIDDVYGMLEDLRTYGYITGAYLGVSVSNVNPEDAALYGLPMGVLVHDVVEGNSAQKGGIKPQDIITNIGGYDIENLNDLTRALRHFKAGDTVTATVYRHSSGGEMVLSLVLDEKPRA